VAGDSRLLIIVLGETSFSLLSVRVTVGRGWCFDPTPWRGAFVVGGEIPRQVPESPSLVVCFFWRVLPLVVVRRQRDEDAWMLEDEDRRGPELVVATAFGRLAKGVRRATDAAVPDKYEGMV